VKMLERLSITTQRQSASGDDLAGLVWTPLQTIDAFGVISDAQNMSGIEDAWH